MTKTTRLATNEENQKVNDFLKENNFKLLAEVVTTYPEGVAKTTSIVSVIVEEEKGEITEEDKQ